MKVSVIVPVYGVEKYLDACVESIVKQTHQNLEIILIDDGSPDNCPEMCDEWAEKDDRIIVIHKENGGLSSARNFALDSISGEYVAFVDSDDWLSPNWIESLYGSIKKNGSLIAVGGICSCSAIRQKYTNIVDNEECVISPNQMIKYITEPDIRSTVTNKLYHKSLFENLRFPLGRINEDAYITPELLGNSEKISFAKDCYYYIRIRNDSITKQTFSIKSLDLLYANNNMLKYYEENYSQLLRLALAHRTNEILYLLKSLFIKYDNKTCKDIELKLRNTLIDTLKKYENTVGEMYGYSILSDVNLYLDNRTKFIKGCKSEALHNKIKKIAIKIISIIKK